MIRGLDHLVLTVRDLAATRDFYGRGLDLVVETAPNGRTAFLFGRQKLSLHQAFAASILLRARVPTPGGAGLCLVADRPLDDVVAHLGRREITVALGPVDRHGAHGPMRSMSLRDPDGNLVDIADDGHSAG